MVILRDLLASSVYLFILNAFNLQHIKWPIKAIKLNNQREFYNHLCGFSHRISPTMSKHNEHNEEKYKKTLIEMHVIFARARWSEIWHVRRVDGRFIVRTVLRKWAAPSRERRTNLTFLNVRKSARKNLHLNESITVLSELISKSVHI